MVDGCGEQREKQGGDKTVKREGSTSSDSSHLEAEKTLSGSRERGSHSRERIF